MNKYTAWWYKLLHKITGFFSSVHWQGLRALFNGGIYYDLTEADHNEIKRLLSSGYYIILTWRKCHLTSWMIGALNLIKDHKWPSYCHALMNCDAVDDVNQWDKFKLMEATNQGVHTSSFMNVFDCDHVALLRAKNITKDEWNAVVDGLLEQDGYKYDDLFDLSDKTHVSCVELVLNALKKEPNYEKDFANLEAMIKKVGNLTPEMYRDCPDFEVVFERLY
jgi:hypothetical protein